MLPAIRPYAPADRAALHALLRDPSLEPEFGWLLDNGELDDPLRHPFGEPSGVWVAESGDGLVGFAELLRFDSARGEWSLARVAVREPERRRGLGTALFRTATEHLRARGVPAGHPLSVSHWDPNPAADGFARALGLEHERYFWNMERPGRASPAVEWPPGIEARTFDGGEPALIDWRDCYNAAFAENARNITATLEQCHWMMRQPQFDPSGLLLAYRAGRCVGFCRCAIYPDYGDLDVLGVAPEARGIGLGRAVVRWGVAWLLAHEAPSVQLTVDGENERALRLYRSEGFETVKTRRIWRVPGSAR